MVEMVLTQLDLTPCSEKHWVLRTADCTAPLYATSTRIEQSYGWATQYDRALEEEGTLGGRVRF